MNYYYDLHIHTALSPCGDVDMTPNNIVNMALLKELNVIAVTDHNTCGNAEAVIEAAEGTGLIVIPGMEVETAEAVHVVCLFPSIESAKQTETIVWEMLPPIKNREDIFGEQLYFNQQDEITGKESRLLLVSSALSVEMLFEQVERAGGIAIPAHIDRPAYSILASLGGIPETLPVKLIEISQSISEKQFFQQYPEYQKYQVLRSSDAHYLEDIVEKQHFLTLSGKNAAEIVEQLRRK